GARQIHGDQRVEHARRDAPLRDQAAKASPRREVRVEVERVAVAGDLGVELDLVRGDGLGAARALSDLEPERADLGHQDAGAIRPRAPSAAPYTTPAARSLATRAFGMRRSPVRIASVCWPSSGGASVAAPGVSCSRT